MSERNDNEFNLNNLDDVDEASPQEQRKPPAAPKSAGFNPYASAAEPGIGSGKSLDLFDHDESDDEVEDRIDLSRSAAPTAPSTHSPENIADPLQDQPSTHTSFPEQPQPSAEGKSLIGNLPLALSGGALLFSLIAMIAALSAGGGSDHVDQLSGAQQSELSEELYREMRQELTDQVAKLESQQKYLRDSFNQQFQRLESKLAERPAPVQRTEKPRREVRKPTPVVTPAPAPVARALPEPITEAPATHPAPKATAIAKPGSWAVNILSMENKSAAEKERKRLNAKGIPVDISTFYMDGALKYRVRVAGFADRAAADAYKKELASKHGIKDAWVYKP